MPFFPVQRYALIEDPLDLYDPWRGLDLVPATFALQPNGWRSICNNHKCHQHSTNPQARKFRVQLDVNGFKPETINTKVEGQKLIVEAKQEDRQEDGDFNIRQLRKSYELPKHADASQLVSYVTRNNMLVIEVPIKDPEQEKQLEQAQKDKQSLSQFGQFLDPLFDYAGFLNGSDFQPKIVDKGENQKQLEMIIGMKNLQPNEMKVSIKDNELIVKGEHRNEGKNGSEQSFFYRSIMLPPGTQIDQLESHLTDDGQLKIEAPYVEPKQAIEKQNQENHKPIENQQQ